MLRESTTRVEPTVSGHPEENVSAIAFSEKIDDDFRKTLSLGSPEDEVKMDALLCQSMTRGEFGSVAVLNLNK
jgi:hypothetical protein